MNTSIGSWYLKGYPPEPDFDIGDNVRTTWQPSVYGITYEGVIVGIGHRADMWLVQQEDGTTDMVNQIFLERIIE